MAIEHLKYFTCTAGAITYTGFFSRGEHHLYGVRYLQVFTIAFCLTFFAISPATNYQTSESLSRTTVLVFWYLLGLFGTLFANRAYYSPLNNFPGPLYFKISSLGFSWHVRRGDSHAKLLKLHHTYGDFVRVGSADLSIVHPQAVKAIYGRNSQCTKAAWYDLNHPMTSMQTTRDRKVHDQRRRVWGPAFSEGAVSGYEERVRSYQDVLMRRIAEQGSRSVDVRELFELYNFDVMGDLAFGEPFHMAAGYDATLDYWSFASESQAIGVDVSDLVV